MCVPFESRGIGENGLSIVNCIRTARSRVCRGLLRDVSCRCDLALRQASVGIVSIGRFAKRHHHSHPHHPRTTQHHHDKLKMTQCNGR